MLPLPPQGRRRSRAGVPALAVVVVATLLSSLTTTAHAQTIAAVPGQAAAPPTPTGVAKAPPLTWTLQVDPLTTAIGFVHLQIERVLNDRWSMYAGPHLRLFDSLIDDKVEPYTGVGVEVGLRYFIHGTAPAGLWSQFRGVAARLLTDKAGGSTALGGYGSALLGYTAIFSRRWVLAGGLGVQYLHYRIAGMGPKMWFAAAHTTVGVAF